MSRGTDLSLEEKEEGVKAVTDKECDSSQVVQVLQAVQLHQGLQEHPIYKYSTINVLHMEQNHYKRPILMEGYIKAVQ